MRASVFAANRIALIGIASSAGARRVGQEQAPRRFRNAGLLECLRSAGYDVVDLGDSTPVTYSPDTANPKRQNVPLVLSVLEQVAEAVDSAVARQARPFVFGGDCTITIGVVAALTNRCESLGLVYFDGDLDLNTPETTLSGILDGMALAHILGEGTEELSHFGSRYPLLNERDVALFGYSMRAGGIDPAEERLLERTVMAAHPLEGIKGRAGAAAAQALGELESRTEHVLIHFDVDVIDVHDLPAVDVPHSPGLSLSEAQEALSVFLGSPKVAGLVLTEFNAGRDPDGKLARRLNDMLRTALSSDQANEPAGGR